LIGDVMLINETKKNVPLHALLAAENDIRSQTNVIIRETLKMFDKPTTFDEWKKTYAPFSLDDKDIVGTDMKTMVTTVTARIDYIKSFIVKEIDTLCSKEKTNTVAKADIVIKDEEGNITDTIAKDVPVSALLQLEKKFNDYRKIYAAIPTTNSEIEWIKGINGQGVECWIEKETRKSIRTRNETITERFDPNPEGLAPDKKKFKVEPIQRNVKTPIGTYTEIKKSGAITPHQKAIKLNRFDQIVTAIKQARSTANTATILECKIGNNIMKFINE